MVHKEILISIVALLMLLLSSTTVWASEDNSISDIILVDIERNDKTLEDREKEADPIVSSSAVTSQMSYQGRLNDNTGNPLDGTYSMTFRLYDVSSGGTALDTDTHNVEVSNGLFNTYLDFDPYYFDSKELWLGIRVESDSEMTPRQEFRPVPYALSLRPGAVIDGSVGKGCVLNINNSCTSSVGNGICIYTHAPGSDGVWTKAYGDVSTGYYACMIGNESHGICASAYGEQCVGIFGQAGNYDSNYGSGGVFVGKAKNGVGIQGIASNSDDNNYDPNYGGCFVANGRRGHGIYAKVDYPGSGLKYAGYFECDSDTGYGVYAKVNGDYTNWAVRGEGTGFGSGGGWFSTTSEGHVAVYGYATSTTGTSNYNKGGQFKADGNNGYGVHAVAPGTHGTGIYASGGPSGYAAIFGGNVKITSQSSGATIMELGEGLDYAEGFDVSDPQSISPGTVLIIDPDNPGKLSISCTPYDTKVAGIVAGANDMGSGVRLGADQFDCDVALAGRVYCNVDATDQGIEPGDMLTTSDKPGYAMKSTDNTLANGAILGKAMESLEKGRKGQILVLVTLQ